MTDKPAATAPSADAEQPRDPTLLPRRALVWILSLILAVITMAAALTFLLPLIWPNNGSIPLNATIPISFVELPLLPLLAIPMTLFFMIWVDYFLKTRIVND